MHFTAPLPERLFFTAARTAIVFVRDLKALDWVLVGVIAALVVPVPVYRAGATRGLQGLLVLLAALFTLVNLYILAASWTPDLISPEKSTLALVDISNFISPIAADSVLLYNTVLDNLVQGMSFQQLAVTSAAPFILKIGRLLDSIPFIRDRMGLVMGRIKEDEEYGSYALLRPDRVASVKIDPKMSVEIGTGMQIFDNLYTFFLFLKSVNSERKAARREGPSHIPRTALASQPSRTLILLSFTNFIAPIILSAAQLVALIKSQDEDDMLPFYLAIVKSLIQILGALSASLLASLQRRKNKKRAALRLEGEDTLSGAQYAVADALPSTVPSSPQTHIDVRHLARRASHTRRSSYSHHHAASGSGTPYSGPGHRWMSYSRAFQEYPEDSSEWVTGARR
ncbi:hypothetical protein PENSPDRAFT_648112 [Peniophora sp. CONT]|nr:hypothetical protein PENSPDRAFT_648112 [Peniophora sp. CONT]